MILKIRLHFLVLNFVCAVPFKLLSVQALITVGHTKTIAQEIVASFPSYGKK